MGNTAIDNKCNEIGGAPWRPTLHLSPEKKQANFRPLNHGPPVGCFATFIQFTDVRYGTTFSSFSFTESKVRDMHKRAK